MPIKAGTQTVKNLCKKTNSYWHKEKYVFELTFKQMLTHKSKECLTTSSGATTGSAYIYFSSQKYLPIIA